MHTGRHRRSHLTWDMAHPRTLITWKVSKDCCLGKIGVSVAPLTFPTVTHEPIKAQSSTYWPFSHTVLSSSQMSLLACGPSAFARTPAPLSEPRYVLTLMSVPGPAHPDSPRAGLTLQCPDLAPTALMEMVQWYCPVKNVRLQPNRSISLPSFIPPCARPRALFVCPTAFSSQRRRLGRDLECEWVAEEMHVLTEWYRDGRWNGSLICPVREDSKK